MRSQHNFSFLAYNRSDDTNSDNLLFCAVCVIQRNMRTKHTGSDPNPSVVKSHQPNTHWEMHSQNMAVALSVSGIWHTLNWDRLNYGSKINVQRLFGNLSWYKAQLPGEPHQAGGGRIQPASTSLAPMHMQLNWHHSPSTQIQQPHPRTQRWGVHACMKERHRHPCMD